ncbi:MAG: hypothetical protein KJP00_15625 [Bacteroidia bacterium]|nr:hypothetical protein [Bacteroidia bacterium]
MAMKKKWEKYQRYIYFGTIVIALGISFSTTLKDSVGALGTVFIAIGGLLFIAGMNEKRKKDELDKKE